MLNWICSCWRFSCMSISRPHCVLGCIMSLTFTDNDDTNVPESVAVHLNTGKIGWCWILMPNASCVLWAFIFFTGCNRCLSSAARSRANSGILIIALATGTGLVAAESEPASYWLVRGTVQSTEFHLMKGSVQQAAARGCSLRVGDPATCHFSLSFSVRARLPVWNTQICIITQINSSFGCKNTTCM